MQEYFSRIFGVVDTTCGYANGATENPTYEEVCYANTGHAEAVHVTYDPTVVDLRTLAQALFAVIDPTSVNRQGNDIGTQYRTGVYYTDAADLSVLKETFAEERAHHDAPLATELLPLSNFYLAEDYHQDYLKKNPHGYCHIPGLT